MPLENGLAAYHGDPAVKLKYVGRMRAHQKADELVHGTYWNDGRGCSVGCTIHSADYDKYETELGMPEWFAYLEDQIFNGMSVAASHRFPLDLLSAIPAGFAKWDDLYHAFCIFLLRDICKFDREAYPDTAAAVDAVIRLHEKWAVASVREWSAAAQMAWLAAESAPSEAAEPARSAARSVKWSAAAAWSVLSAAKSAWLAARSAAESADEMAYDRMGDWLVRQFVAAEETA